MLSELRFAVRQLSRSPGFSTVAILSLALAIGVNSVVFTIVNALFLRPLIPLRPDEVVNVYTAREAADRDYRPFSFPEFSLLRESHDVFADVAAFRFAAAGVAAHAGEPMRRHFGFVVSDNYFSMLGVKPAAGRFFVPEESVPDANVPVAVVSLGFWRSLGGGDTFTSRTVSINGETWNIVGVAPEGFSGGNALLAPDIWLPLGMASHLSKAFGKTQDRHDLADPANHSLFVVARLRPGMTPQSAEARLPAIAARLTTIAVDEAEGTRVLGIGRPSRFNFSTEPSSDGPLGLFGVLLLGMAGVVLLVACLNLANMFLARNLTRSPELAVRLALGASRWQVVKTLCVEGLMVATLGGAAGLLLSNWAGTLLLDSLMRSASLSTLGFSLAFDATPDVRVLLATLAFGALAALVFSLGPALHATREIARGNLSLQHSVHTSTQRSARLFSGRNCLLMAQLAFSLALLFSAGLFLRAAHAAAQLDPGFNPKGDLVAKLDYSLVDRDAVTVRNALLSMVDTLRALPAVRDVGLASQVPFGNVDSQLDVTAADGAEEQPPRVRGTLTAVSAGYFDAIGVRLLRGRDFTEAEWRDPDGPAAVIIDERAAATLFPNENPLGKYIRRTRRQEESVSAPMQVIGVVSAHWEQVFADGPPPRLFLPLAQSPAQHVYLHVRGRTADGDGIDALRAQVRNGLMAMDAEIPLIQLTPFSAIMNGNLELWSVRFAATLFGIFGLIALLLAVVGVYGMEAFIVARRRREFGIRVALGARPRQVLGPVMKQGVVQIAIGLSAGLLLALTAGQLLASMLLRISPHDPLALLVAALPLVGATLFACWLPAKRAIRVDPMEALRTE